MNRLQRVVQSALGAWGTAQEAPPLNPLTATSTFRPSFTAANAPATFVVRGAPPPQQYGRYSYARKPKVLSEDQKREDFIQNCEMNGGRAVRARDFTGCQSSDGSMTEVYNNRSGLTEKL